MSLLEEIQSAAIAEGTEIGPILLKLRLLAARLGSAPLEEWVKYESEGYPKDATLPSYRVIGVSYTGTFSGPFGSGVNNAPIPPYLIERFAGEKWNHHEIRQSISGIDDLVKSATGSGMLQINAANLILLLQGKVYEGYACNAVIGTVSRAALVEVQHAVRSRVLELTIQFEKFVPGATEITFGSQSMVAVNSEQVTQITNQTIYGNVTSIASTGAGASFNIAIRQGDQASFVDALVNAGIPKEDASELAAIVATEKPESNAEPFGTKAKTWVVDNLKKAASGTWKMGVTVATAVLKEAALRYYGLK
jgi:hypothetical protein